MNGNGVEEDATNGSRSAQAAADAASRVSEIISRAGSGSAFDGQSLGVGGLDDVLAQIKRRIWTPLAAPPQLLKGACVPEPMVDSLRYGLEQTMFLTIHLIALQPLFFLSSFLGNTFRSQNWESLRLAGCCFTENRDAERVSWPRRSGRCSLPSDRSPS